MDGSTVHRLSTRRLLLRPLRPEDLGFVFDLYSDIQANRRDATVSSMPTLEGMRARIATWISDRQCTHIGYYLITLAETEVPVGIAGAHLRPRPLDASSAPAVLVLYCRIHWNARRRRYASEALEGVIGAARAAHPDLRLECEFPPANAAASALARHLGLAQASCRPLYENQ